MMEPIIDDELQRLRRQTVTLENAGYVTGTYRIDGFLRLLARLDAAESRAAELQREVERLQVSLLPVCSLPVDVAAEIEVNRDV